MLPSIDNNPSSPNYFETIHKMIINSMIYKNILIQDYTIIPKNRSLELLLGINVFTVEMSNDLNILEFFTNNKINFLGFNSIPPILASSSKYISVICNFKPRKINKRINMLRIFLISNHRMIDCYLHKEHFDEAFL